MPILLFAQSVLYGVQRVTPKSIKAFTRSLNMHLHFVARQKTKGVDTRGR